MIQNPALWISFVLCSAPCLAQTCDVRLQSSDLAGGDKFGSAVAIDGQLAITGASQDRGASPSEVTGSVYVHALDNLTGEWTEVAKFAPSNLVGEDRFGSSLDLSGQTLAVSAPNRNNVLATDLGQVYVYTHGGAGTTWTLEGEVSASDGVLSDEFGIGLGIAGDFLIAGAPYHDGGAANSGAAYVFERVGGTWSQSQKLDQPAAVNGTLFGRVVAMDGDLAVVGSTNLTTPGNNGGALCAYQRDGSGQYQFLHVVQPANLQIADFFATSVDLHGDLLVVGTTYDDDGGSNAGAVHVFRFDSLTSTFVEEAKLQRANPVANDRLGTSVATDGITIAAGVDQLDPAGGVVTWRDLGSGWVPFREVTPQELGTNGTAGNAVAVEGDTLLTGDVSDNSLFFQGGAVFVTNLSVADNNGNGIGDLCEDLGVVYCDPAVANTTGLPGVVSAFGSPFAADNTLTLEAEQLPSFIFGIFITSQTQGLIQNPGGSQGHLCVVNSIGRYNQAGQIFGTTGAGKGTLLLDLTMTPTPQTPVAVQAGETWNYQAWYRDFDNGMSVSNFTNAISVTFQ